MYKITIEHIYSYIPQKFIDFTDCKQAELLIFFFPSNFTFFFFLFLSIPFFLSVSRFASS